MQRNFIAMKWKRCVWPFSFRQWSIWQRPTEINDRNTTTWFGFIGSDHRTWITTIRVYFGLLNWISLPPCGAACSHFLSSGEGDIRRMCASVLCIESCGPWIIDATVDAVINHWLIIFGLKTLAHISLLAGSNSIHSAIFLSLWQAANDLRVHLICEMAIRWFSVMAFYCHVHCGKHLKCRFQFFQPFKTKHGKKYGFSIQSAGFYKWCDMELNFDYVLLQLIC